MLVLEKVKGFKKLTKSHQDIFIATYARHQKGIGHEYKDDYTPIEVQPLGNNVKVIFKNGIWLHYTPKHDWY